MEKTKYTIGRASNNDIVYDEPSISGHHASIQIEKNNQYIIYDELSTNGTYINGTRKAKSFLKASDMLYLGTYEVDVDSLFKEIDVKYNSTKRDYSDEFQKLIPVFEEYEDKKNKILHPSKWPLFIRAFLSVAILIVLIFFGEWIPNNTIRYALIMSIGLFSVVASLFRSSVVKRNQALDLLKIEFEDQLICPKCSIVMLNQSITYWKGKKRCTNSTCNASF